MKAVLVGSTGLVGQEILKSLIQNHEINEIKSFSRNTTPLKSPKLSQRIIDFEQMHEWDHELEADIAFSALGTTRSRAGSYQNQYKVDYTFQAQFAQACRKNHVSHFVLISSIGAGAKSKIPYLKMKGELEDFVIKLNFQHLKILRPGPLVGARNHRRFAEEMMLPFNRFLARIPGLSDLQPVSASQVAKVAVQSAFDESEQKIVDATQIRKFKSFKADDL